MARTQPALPGPVLQALRKLGRDIKVARIRRRLPVAVVAERALIAQGTLGRVERGDPSVSLGIYATVLFVLGFNDRLMNLADVASDAVGLSLEEERLPRRIRHPHPRRG